MLRDLFYFSLMVAGMALFEVIVHVFNLPLPHH